MIGWCFLKSNLGSYIGWAYSGTGMTSIGHVLIGTHHNGSWFQTNPLDHELDDLTSYTVSPVCVTNGKNGRDRYGTSGANLINICHCSAVPLKPKFKTRPRYWFLWESCELRFPKFTNNFVSFFRYSFKNRSFFILLK